MDVTGIEAPALLALCVFQEAGNQPDDGKAAVAQVVLNRTQLKYASDGSVEGTILHPDAFSWVAWQMVNRIYEKVVFSQAEQIKRVRSLFELTQKAAGWALCERIAQEVMGGTYAGDAFKAITPDTVLYFNPSIVRQIPAWAKPENLVMRIGAQWFYRA